MENVFIEGKVYQSTTFGTLVLCIDSCKHRNYFVGIPLNRLTKDTVYNTYITDIKNTIKNYQKSVYKLYTKPMLLGINNFLESNKEV